MNTVLENTAATIFSLRTQLARQRWSLDGPGSVRVGSRQDNVLGSQDARDGKSESAQEYAILVAADEGAQEASNDARQEDDDCHSSALIKRPEDEQGYIRFFLHIIPVRCFLESAVDSRYGLVFLSSRGSMHTRLQ